MPPALKRAVTGSFPARARCLVVIASVACFCALITASICIYPGGNIEDFNAAGHHFWLNFWCDLTPLVAKNGQPNAVGGMLARAALLVLALGLAALWSLVPRLWTRNVPVARLASGLGMLGTAGLVVLAVGPRTWHDGLTLMSGLLGLLAAVPTGVHLLHGPQRGLAWLTAFAIAAASANLLVWMLAPSTVALAAVQKIASLAVLGWAVAVAVAAWPGAQNPAAALDPGCRAPSQSPGLL